MPEAPDTLDTNPIFTPPAREHDAECKEKSLAEQITPILKALDKVVVCDACHPDAAAHRGSLATLREWLARDAV